jgi:heat shock protein HtpX
MYQQIASNKRRTFILLFSFMVLLWCLAYVISKATGNPGLLFVIGLFSIGYSIFSYFGGAKMAITVNRAQEIQKKDDPRLWRTVENLCIAEGLPMPKVYIMDDPAPNAFATGRDPKHGIVCATTGLLEIMDNQELEGVIAHELGHIKNYDIRVNTIAFALVGVVSMIADFFLHISIFGSRDREGNSLMIVVAIVAAIIAPIAATMLQLSISRRREYLADATGALATRFPEGLADALEKIGNHGSVLRKQNTSTAHMFIANPLKGKGFMGLFSTHPPIEERIKILREMKL